MNIFMRQIVFLLLVATLPAGCIPAANGRGVRRNTWPELSWERVGQAACDASMDLQTLIPAAGAIVFTINDFDEKTSDWAGRHHPLFRSNQAANLFSDCGQYVMLAEPFITTLLAPRGNEEKDWLLDKAWDVSVDLAAVGLTAGTTGLLKKTTHRPRPSGKGFSSFPSGHTSCSFAGATLADNNLNRIDMNRPARRSLQAFNLLLATTVGWSRIEGRQHYPSDVLAGAAIGHFLSCFINGAFSDLPGESQFSLAVLPLVNRGVVAGLAMRF